MSDQQQDQINPVPPREIKLLENYFLGLPLYLCAKLAKYRTTSKRKLRRITREVVERHVSQAGKDEIAQRAGGHVAAWWRDLLWAKKRARARGDLKNMVAVLKMQGEAIGVLKSKEFEGEQGATIVINTGSEGKKKAKKPAKQGPGKVLKIATEDS